MTEKKSKMTVEELAEFFHTHKDDRVLSRIFEMEYTFGAVMERYGAKEVARRIRAWHTVHGTEANDK